jgi:hypothetical protein
MWADRHRDPLVTGVQSSSQASPNRPITDGLALFRDCGGRCGAENASNFPAKTQQIFDGYPIGAIVCGGSSPGPTSRRVGQDNLSDTAAV